MNVDASQKMVDDTGGRSLWPFVRSMAGIGLVVGLLALASGCEKRDSPTGGDDPSAGEVERPEVVTSESLPEDPERIVSLAPNVTETLFALGLGDRVVGVTKHCDYPEEATELPKVGSFANLDFESILARDPDLVIGLISGGKKALADRLDGLDVPHAMVRMYSIEDTFRGIVQIGRWVGAEKEAKALVDQMRAEMREISTRWKGSTTPEVLLVYGHRPLVAAGPGTFGHQLLERAGATNAVTSAETRFPRLDVEKVVELDPDLILDTTMSGDADDGDFWSSHDVIPAVSKGNVVVVTESAMLRPGPRLPEALSMIGRAIHGGDE